MSPMSWSMNQQNPTAFLSIVGTPLQYFMARGSKSCTESFNELKMLVLFLLFTCDLSLMTIKLSGISLALF